MYRHLVLWAVLSILLSAGAGLAATAPARDEEGGWYDRWQPALAAARQSSKPVYVYIYMRRKTDEARRAEVGSPNRYQQRNTQDMCAKMVQTTLANQQVKQKLRDYVLCQLDARDPGNAAFMQKYQPKLVPGDQRGIRSYRLPVHLFFDSGGRKICELHGFIPPQWFAETLHNVKILAEAQNAPDDQLRQAVAYVGLGHQCMELYLYDEAKQHLNRAVELDPDNQAGAKADAQLYLTIMTIADNARRACEDLARYLNAYPDSKRRLEARYFRGVAQYVAGNTQRAVEILEHIAALTEGSSAADKRWIDSAMVLLHQLRQADR